MFKLISAVAAAASGAAALGLAAGAFVGGAYPQGEMTARDGRNTSSKLDGGDASSSVKLGGKVLFGVLPFLEVEASVARHVNHPPKSWLDLETIGEADLTLTPVTLGARYLLRVGPGAVFFGAGGGYYWETMGLIGGIVTNRTYEYAGEVAFDGPGAYAALGLTCGWGRFKFDVGPRYHAVWNKGEYNYRYDRWETWPEYHYIRTEEATIHKYYNDQFVEVLIGVNYRIW